MKAYVSYDVDAGYWDILREPTFGMEEVELPDALVKRAIAAREEFWAAQSELETAIRAARR